MICSGSRRQCNPIFLLENSSMLLSARYPSIVEILQRDLMWVNVFWRSMYLLPIYAFDGGTRRR